MQDQAGDHDPEPRYCIATEKGGAQIGLQTRPATCFILGTCLPKTAPNSGPPPPTHKCFARRKVIAAWCWCNFSHSQIGPARHALRVNVGETPSAMFFGDDSGLLVPPAAMNRRAALQQLWKRVPRKHLRGAFTWVCRISNRPEVQRCLPQFLIGNMAILLERDAQTWQSRHPRNVRSLSPAQAPGWMPMD